MFYLYWILFFLDYGKINVRIKIWKRHKLNPPSPKRRSDNIFRSKVDLRVAPQRSLYWGNPVKKLQKSLICDLQTYKFCSWGVIYIN